MVILFSCVCFGLVVQYTPGPSRYGANQDAISLCGSSANSWSQPPLLLVDRYSGRKPHLYTPMVPRIGARWRDPSISGIGASRWYESPVWLDGDYSGRDTTHLGGLLLAQCGLILILVLYAALLRVIGIDRQFGAPKLYLVDIYLYTPMTNIFAGNWDVWYLCCGVSSCAGDTSQLLFAEFRSGRGNNI